MALFTLNQDIRYQYYSSEMKILLLLTTFILLGFTLTAQISLGYRGGYGMYSMKSLAAFQEVACSSSIFPAKVVTQFPGYFTHRLYLGKPNWSPFNGAYVGYLTTAGRISVSDYSGKYRLDMVLNGFQAGFHLEEIISQAGGIDIKGYLEFGATTTFLQLREYLKIGEEEIDETYRFMGHGIDVQPGISATYKLSNIRFGCYLAYELSIAAAFYEQGNPKSKLGVSSNNLAKPEWTGLRTGIEVTYIMGKK